MAKNDVKMSPEELAKLLATAMQSGVDQGVRIGRILGAAEAEARASLELPFGDPGSILGKLVGDPFGFPTPPPGFVEFGLDDFDGDSGRCDDPNCLSCREGGLIDQLFGEDDDPSSTSDEEDVDPADDIEPDQEETPDPVFDQDARC